MKVHEYQAGFVAGNAKSLAEAKANPALTPLGIYDQAALGQNTPEVPMVGFIMYELAHNVGFILRIMIDRQYQRRGYGRAAVREVLRRLKLYPEVEMIATSHQRRNSTAASFFESLGFVEWRADWIPQNGREVYLKLAGPKEAT